MSEEVASNPGKGKEAQLCLHFQKKKKDEHFLGNACGKLSSK
jgi:hypothetical protein